MKPASSAWPLHLAWLSLLLLTAANWWVVESDSHKVWAPGFVIVVGAVKCRVIIRRFMKISTAPLPWRAAFDAWLILVLCVILAGYRLAMH